MNSQLAYDITEHEPSDEVLKKIESKNVPFSMPAKLLGTSLAIYYREAKSQPLLSHEECVELFKRKENGDKKARDIIASSNLFLVIKFANKYSIKYSSISEEDLIQEGNIGLLIAIDKFDYKKGYHFSTYASYWIMQTIVRAIADKSRVIRLPSYVHENIHKVLRAETIFFQENARQPSLNELAEITGLSQEQIIKLKTSYADVVSLSTLINNDEDSELEDFIPNSEISDLQDEYELRNLNAPLCEAISATLGDRSAFIIKKRFGLIDGIPSTLEEIGQELGLSRERVRQILEKGLSKLRKNKEFCKLFKAYAE